jgi:hypothetical protein
MSGTPLCPGLRCVVLAAAEGSLHVCLLALVGLDEPHVRRLFALSQMLFRRELSLARPHCKRLA